MTEPPGTVSALFPKGAKGVSQLTIGLHLFLTQPVGGGGQMDELFPLGLFQRPAFAVRNDCPAVLRL